MLTRRFFIILGGAVVLALLGLIWPPLVDVARFIAWCLIVAAMADGFALLAASLRLRVNRRHNTMFSLEQPNEVTLAVRMALPEAVSRWLQITVYEDMPDTFSCSSQPLFSGTGEHRYHVVPTHRGLYSFPLTRCFLVSRFMGLVEVRRFFRKSQEVKVYPTFHNLKELEVMASQNELQTGPKNVRRAGNNTNFEQIRPYVAGDDVRTINWRATARAASLMVNTYTDERSQPIIPILCAGPSMQHATDGVTLIDRATSAAVALASSALRHYDEAGLITASQRGVERYLAPTRRTDTVARILDATYNFCRPLSRDEQFMVDDLDVMPVGVDPEVVAEVRNRQRTYEAETDFGSLSQYVDRWISRRSLLVLFANFENLTSARHALPSLKRMARRNALVVVLFENEGVINMAKNRDDHTKNKLGEMRFRALCADYLDQQQLLVSFLQKQGINVILTPPQELSAAVLQRYLLLKTQAVI